MRQQGVKVQLPHNWKARAYQAEYMGYMFNGGEFPYRKRAYLTWHRRSGKDSTSINTAAVASQMRVGTFWHLLPTFQQGRKVIWNGVDAQGRRIIHQAFPPEMIESQNDSDMLLRLKNGSFYQVVGSDNFDALVGSNPIGVIFSEWALSDPNAWDFVRPMLAENDGFAAFITTPRGKNHAYRHWRNVKDNPRWFTSLKTVRDTLRENGRPVITEEIIQEERDEGVEEEIIEQEYFCSWEGVNRGSIYGRHLKKYELTHQLAWEPDYDLPVYTAWDIGHRDAAAVWCYQLVGDEIHIVDYLEGSQMDADAWLEEIAKLPWAFGTPALPHDAKARTFATSRTTRDRFIKAGYTPYIVPNIKVADGINAARSIIKHVYFNTGSKGTPGTVSKGVETGLDRLNGYVYEFDEVTKVFSTVPKHDHNSHGADAFRMLALSQNVVAIANRNKNRTVAPPTKKMTPMGPAYRLEELFAEREMTRSRVQRID